MFAQCTVCQQDSAGNHEFGCPNAPKFAALSQEGWQSTNFHFIGSEMQKELQAQITQLQRELAAAVSERDQFQRLYEDSFARIADINGKLQSSIRANEELSKDNDSLRAQLARAEEVLRFIEDKTYEQHTQDAIDRYFADKAAKEGK